MPPAQQFGRRSFNAASAPALPDMPAAPMPVFRTAQPEARAEWPFLTAVLVLGLAGIFYWQVQQAGGELSLSALIAEGAVSRHLVFGEGQFWRIFTAPLLHGSSSHLGGNLTALAISGFYLERTIGRGWLAAIFFVSALGGAAGSMAYIDMPSVGASGAIMGLIAAMLAISFHDAVSSRIAWRMRRYALFTMVPALLPSASGHGVDVGAHFGGAMAGMFLGFAVLMSWEDEADHPYCPLPAAVVGVFGLLFSAFALTLAGTPPPAEAPVAEAAKPPGSELVLAPEMTRDSEEGIASSGDLVDRYPGDPRAHVYRAMYFLRREEPANAAPHLETAKHLIESDPSRFPASFHDQVQLVYALTLMAQGRTDSARREAAPVCGRLNSDPTIRSLRRDIRRSGVCG